MILLKNGKRLLGGLLTAALICAVLGLCYYFDFFHTTQLRCGDSLFKATDSVLKTEKDDRIVIVAIDDRSLQETGQIISWPRSHYARVIDALSESGARVIVFDVLFPDPGQGDGELADSIKSSGNVILPVVYAPPPVKMTQVQKDDAFSRPLEAFEDGAVAVGHANVSPDADGVVRRLPIAIPAGEISEPALALASVAAYLRRPEAAEAKPENTGLPFMGRFIATDGDGNMLINYVSNAQAAGNRTDFELVSFIDVLNGTAESSIFRDKIVIIGTTASGLTDSFWTPLGRKMSGVELHANAIDTILEGAFLRPAPDAATIASVILMGLCCGFIVAGMTILPATITFAGMFLAYFIAAFSLFDSGIMLNMFYPPLALAGTFVGVNLYNVISEQSEKRQITRIFGCYVSPPVLQKIMATTAGKRREQAGEEREVTVLFADVRNFTRLTDKTEPRELVAALNLYLSVIIQQVLNRGGIINKFGGDSIMAVWNTPVACENHALLATEAAARSQMSIIEMQNTESRLLKMEFGMGINTGKALAGNMGSRDRMEYSVIGNTVNLAARIAGAAPGGRVWIGRETYERIKSKMAARQLAPLIVKGKDIPIQVFQVTGFSYPLTDQPFGFTEGVRNNLAKLS